MSKRKYRKRKLPQHDNTPKQFKFEKYLRATAFLSTIAKNLYCMCSSND